LECDIRVIIFVAIGLFQQQSNIQTNGANTIPRKALIKHMRL